MALLKDEISQWCSNRSGGSVFVYRVQSVVWNTQAPKSHRQREQVTISIIYQLVELYLLGQG